MELAGETGSDVALARSEYHLARLAYSEGDHGAARALYAKALGRGGGAAPMAHHQVRCLLGLAEAAAARGEGARAETLFGEAQDQAEATGDRQATARTLAGRAELARARGDLGAAAGLHHRSLELAHEIGELAAVTRSLECVAGLGALAGRPEASARLFGAAAALRERHGLARVALEQPTYDDDVAFTRAGLGDEGWDALSLQGSQLSVDEAVSLAGRGRGERRRPASGWESLTKAEHQVARLVAQGLTNPEVGERLFISRRTVGHHLSHIYAKLGITSRRQLARVAGRPPGS
jgi:DNA-binding CsgD family transcriptional regulator